VETVLKVIAIYVFVLVGLRVLGKREFAELTPLHLVTLLLIPEIASQAMVGEDFSLTNALVGITTVFVIVFLLSAIVHTSKPAEKLIQGGPTILAYHGRLLESNLNKERMTGQDVMTEARSQGLESLSQVKWAVLEDTGRISIIPEESAKR
jgi:uncharacterized membrane protein YcaP (DUF421 family)